MAKVGFGPFVTDARGSTGAVTFTRNRAGQFTRARVTPINPSTARQNTVRANLRNAVLIWQTTLTDAQRLAWDVFAASFPTTTPIAGTHPLTGFAAYLRSAQIRQNLGAVPLQTPSGVIALVEPTSLAISALSAGGGTFTVTFAPNPAGNNRVVISATPQLSPGIRYCWRHLQQMLIVVPPNTSPQSIFTAYTAAFGPLIAGKRIGVTAYVADIGPGLKSQTLRTSALVAA